MERTKTRSKKWILWLIAALALTLLLLVGLYVLGGGSVSAHYDDASSLLFSYDFDSFDGASVESDGTLRVRLTHDDLYWYAKKYGVADAVLAPIRADENVTDAGFRLSGGSVIVSLRSRLLGFLPLTYRAEMTAHYDDASGELVLHTEKVSLGRHITAPARFWPGFFTGDLRIPLHEASPAIRSAELDADALILTMDGLTAVPVSQLQPDTAMIEACRVFLPEERKAAQLPECLLPGVPVSAREAWEYALASDVPEEALSTLLSLCTSETAEAAFSNADPLTRELLARPLLRAAADRREALKNELREEQSRYERLLTAVRDMYKSSLLTIGETGFLVTATGAPLTPADLTTLSITATDTRAVFLWSETDKGAPCTEDMPPVSEIRRAVRGLMEEQLDAERIYDLGVALTSEGGLPLLVSRRSDGMLLLQVLEEQQYVSLLVERPVPVLCLDTLPSASGQYTLPAGEGYSGALLLCAPEGSFRG